MRRLLLPLLLGLLPACGESAREPASARPVRICSVTLAADEMLADLVDVERVVAVTRYADDPTVSNVAGHWPETIMRIGVVDLESVVKLDPDLVVLSMHNEADFLELIHAAGIPTLRIEAHDSYADVRHAYLELGRAVGESARADEVVARFDAGLARLEEALAGIEHRPRVLYWAGGWTTGTRSTTGELIERAGGENLAAELGMEESGEVDSERAVAAHPDHLLLSRWTMADDEGYSRLPDAFAELDAVREGRVIELEGRLLGSLSKWLVVGAWRLARILHPEVIDEADVTRALEELVVR